MSTDAASRTTATKIILFLICFFNIDYYLIELEHVLKTVLFNFYCFVTINQRQKLVQNFDKCLFNAFLKLFILGLQCIALKFNCLRFLCFDVLNLIYLFIDEYFR